MAEGMFKMMDESIFCARMCIHQKQMKKKKKKKNPLEKGAGREFFFVGEGGRSPGK
jgi:hypothetical protein